MIDIVTHAQPPTHPPPVRAVIVYQLICPCLHPFILFLRMNLLRY